MGFLKRLFGAKRSQKVSKLEKLGSESDQFRRMLFADDDVAVFLTRLSSNMSAPPGSPAAMLEALRVALAKQKSDEAKQLLRSIADLPHVEARLCALCCNALVKMGIYPEEGSRAQVFGVVFEVPMAGGIDILSVYADGTARYINHTGSAIVQEDIDEVVVNASKSIRDAVGPFLDQMVGVFDHPQPSGQNVFVTALTNSGNKRASRTFDQLHQHGAPFAEAFLHAAKLLQYLVAKTEK